jgi:hypothetical protein
MVSQIEYEPGKLILLSLIAVLLGVGLFFALSYAIKLQHSTSDVKSENPIENRMLTVTTAEGVNEEFGLRLVMQLEKTEYNLGDPINVSLALTNIGNQTIDFQYSARTLDFRVYNDTDNDMYEWSAWRILPCSFISMPIDPGMGLARVLVWPQLCNRSVNLLTYEIVGVPASPGTYFIVGQASYLVSGQGYELQTTPVQVTIVEP